MKVGRESEVRYPATFHIGFIQESEEQVNEVNRRLKDDGFDVLPPGRLHGSWTFYFLARGDSPSRCWLEITACCLSVTRCAVEVR